MTTYPPFRRVWMDTETTKLSILRRAWDVALIVREHLEDVDYEYQWFVHPFDLDLENADPKALEIGGFWQRHPHAPALLALGYSNDDLGALRELDMRTLPAANVRRARYIARDVHALTRDRAMIYGSNPGFDMYTLGVMCEDEGLAPEWHYHPNDVPSLIEGWLMGRGQPVPADRHARSEAFCRAVGVDPSNYPRHSAIGDCRLFRDAYDAIAKSTP